MDVCGYIWIRLYGCVCIFMFLFILVTDIEVRLPGHMVTLFKHLSNYQTVFFSDCHILYYCHFCMRVLMFSHLWQHLLLSEFFVLVMLVLWLGEAVLCEWRS